MADLSSLSDAQLNALISQHPSSLSNMSNEALDKAISSHPDSGPGMTEDLLRAAIDSGTFGLTDKVAAGVRTLFNNPDNKSYADNLKYEMGQTANTFDRHPIAAPAAAVAGGLPLLLVPGVGEAGQAANAGKLAQLLSIAGKGALTGATYGGLSGAGHTKSLEDLPIDTAKGAAVGGALGGIAAPIISEASPYISKAAGYVSKLPARIIGGVPKESLDTAYAAGKYGPVSIGTDEAGESISPKSLFFNALRGKTDLADTLQPQLKEATNIARDMNNGIDPSDMTRAQSIVDKVTTPNNEIVKFITGDKKGMNARNDLLKAINNSKSPNPILSELGDLNPDLEYQVAGQALNPFLAHGVGSLPVHGVTITPGLHVPGALLEALGSPRLNGLAAYGLGATSRGMTSAKNAVNNTINKIPGVTGNHLTVQNLANLLATLQGNNNGQ